jgi:hypothetical protein
MIHERDLGWFYSGKGQLCASSQGGIDSCTILTIQTLRALTYRHFESSWLFWLSNVFNSITAQVREFKEAAKRKGLDNSEHQLLCLEQPGATLYVTR